MIRTAVQRILNANSQRGHPRGTVGGSARGSLVVSLAGAFALGSFAVTGAADDTMREGTAAYGEQSHHQEGERQTQAQTQTAKVHASAAQVRMIQERLAEAGYDPGEPNGQWTASTKEAVKNFQQANDLTPTGRLDTSLLSALDAEGVIEGRTEQGFFERLGAFFGQEADETLTGEATPIYVSPEHVARVQEELRNQGFDPGQVDGQWGASTAQAANEFRQQHGLERSQVLDVALLSALDTDRVLSSESGLRGDAAMRDRTAATPGTTGEQAQDATGEAQRTDDARMAAVGDAEPVALHADRQTIMAVQRKLQDEGHDPGAVDGQWGESTQAAIRSYQQESDELAGNGELTLPTLAALDIDIQDADYLEQEREAGERR